MSSENRSDDGGGRRPRSVPERAEEPSADAARRSQAIRDLERAAYHRARQRYAPLAANPAYGRGDARTDLGESTFQSFYREELMRLRPQFEVLES